MQGDALLTRSGSGAAAQATGKVRHRRAADRAGRRATHRSTVENGEKVARRDEVGNALASVPLGAENHKFAGRSGVPQAAWRATAVLAPASWVAAARLAFLFCPCGNTKSHPTLGLCPPLHANSIAVGKDSGIQTQYPPAVFASYLRCIVLPPPIRG